MYDEISDNNKTTFNNLFIDFFVTSASKIKFEKELFDIMKMSHFEKKRKLKSILH